MPGPRPNTMPIWYRSLLFALSSTGMGIEWLRYSRIQYGFLCGCIPVARGGREVGSAMLHLSVALKRCTNMPLCRRFGWETRILCRAAMDRVCVWDLRQTSCGYGPACRSGSRRVRNPEKWCWLLLPCAKRSHAYRIHWANGKSASTAYGIERKVRIGSLSELGWLVFFLL